jgi:hypothetical protein
MLIIFGLLKKRREAIGVNFLPRFKGMTLPFEGVTTVAILVMAKLPAFDSIFRIRHEENGCLLSVSIAISITFVKRLKSQFRRKLQQQRRMYYEIKQ